MSARKPGKLKAARRRGGRRTVRVDAKWLGDLKKELSDLKEAYFDMVDRMECIEDAHPQVLDTLRDHGFINDDND